MAVNRFDESSNRVPTDRGPLLGVSKTGNLCAANGFGNLMSPETGAHCFEEGPFRGAFHSGAN